MGEDYDRATSLYDSIVHLAKQKGDPNLIARAYRIYGYMYLDLGDDSQALDMLDQSYKAFPDDSNAPEIHRISSVLLRRLEQYDKAIAFCDEAIILFRKMNDEKKVSHCYVTQGLTYKAMGDGQKAKEWLSKALDLRKKLFPADDPLIQECVDYLNSISVGG